MEVLIAGAGIAGPTLAHWLLRAGHEPVLVERAPEPRRGGHLVDFWGAGFDVAEKMGIGAELRRRDHRFSGARVVASSGGAFASFAPDAFVEKRWATVRATSWSPSCTRASGSSWSGCRCERPHDVPDHPEVHRGAPRDRRRTAGAAA